MTPLRLTILQCSQSLFTEARTFIIIHLSLPVMQPVDKSYGDISMVTLSPGKILVKFISVLPEIRANNLWPLGSSTRNLVLGRTSTMMPSTLIASSLHMLRSLALIQLSKPYAQSEQRVYHLL